MRDVVTIAKALSDANRVRIVAMLDGGSCVCVRSLSSWRWPPRRSRSTSPS